MTAELMVYDGSTLAMKGHYIADKANLSIDFEGSTSSTFQMTSGSEQYGDASIGDFVAVVGLTGAMLAFFPTGVAVFRITTTGKSEDALSFTATDLVGYARKLNYFRTSDTTFSAAEALYYAIYGAFSQISVPISIETDASSDEEYELAYGEVAVADVMDWCYENAGIFAQQMCSAGATLELDLAIKKKSSAIPINLQDRDFVTSYSVTESLANSPTKAIFYNGSNSAGTVYTWYLHSDGSVTEDADGAVTPTVLHLESYSSSDVSSDPKMESAAKEALAETLEGRDVEIQTQKAGFYDYAAMSPLCSISLYLDGTELITHLSGVSFKDGNDACELTFGYWKPSLVETVSSMKKSSAAMFEKIKIKIGGVK